MKKIVLSFIVAFSLLLVFSCNKKEIIEFDMPYTTDIVLPVSSFTAGTMHTFTTQSIWTRAGELFDAQGTNSDIVGEITYTKFTLAVKTPTTGNFNWLDQIRFYAQTEGQPELEVASKYDAGSDSIPHNAKSFDLKFTGANMKNRFVENAITYKIKLLPRNVPVTTTLTLTHNLHVKAIK